MASTIGRTRIRQMDMVEWFSVNRTAIKTLRAERWKVEKGVWDYLKDGASFITDMRRASKDRKAKAAAKAADPVAVQPGKVELSALDQYYVSQELLKRMKWKRVTWDNDADYDSFNRRLLDNDSLFGKIPAMSFMCIHIVRDPAAPPVAPAPPDARQITSIKQGTLTSWFFNPARPNSESPLRKLAEASLSKHTQQAPVTVDWEAGTVRVLDSTTAQEMLTYLETTAGRVQALQQRMEEEQTKITEDLDTLRIRLGVTAIKVNKFDKAFWDDALRREDPANYVTPAELRQFIDSAFKRGFLLRKYLKGNQIRIVPSGKPYAIDTTEKELHIPANFSEYNFLRLHARWESLERIANGFRSTSMLWFFVVMMFVGDFELL